MTMTSPSSAPRTAPRTVFRYSGGGTTSVSTGPLPHLRSAKLGAVWPGAGWASLATSQDGLRRDVDRGSLRYAGGHRLAPGEVFQRAHEHVHGIRAGVRLDN